jgi:hypothetical protein
VVSITDFGLIGYGERGNTSAEGRKYLSEYLIAMPSLHCKRSVSKSDYESTCILVSGCESSSAELQIGITETSPHLPKFHSLIHGIREINSELVNVGKYYRS